MPRRKSIEYKTAATPRAVTTDGVPVFCAFDELISTQSTQPNPLNPNQHGPEQVRLLGAIIRSAGWRAPITISRRSGLIVKGHGRRLAALHRRCYAVELEPRYCDVTVRRFMALKNIKQVHGTDRNGKKIIFEEAGHGGAE